MASGTHVGCIFLLHGRGTALGSGASDMPIGQEAPDYVKLEFLLLLRPLHRETWSKTGVVVCVLSAARSQCVMQDLLRKKPDILAAFDAEHVPSALSCWQFLLVGAM